MLLESSLMTDVTPINEYAQKELLRLLICGSVDDGKSTLTGRILYESQLIYDDQLARLAADSKKFGTTEEELDLALLVDGLLAEREQGITIDVAYRYFAGKKRKFILADTPGHEQYTRNMATGASTAQLAVVLVDARKGLVTQTRRHTFIVAMLGVKKIMLAVNKMDLVNYDQEVFEQIRSDYQEFLLSAGISEFSAIPLSALKGDNITTLSAKTAWYQGPTLVQHLEEVPLESPVLQQSFRMAVQLVTRCQPDFRGYAGRISSGVIRPGDRVRIVPGNQQTRISRIVSYDGDLTSAQTGQSITLAITDDLDITRGMVFASVDASCETADQFSGRLLWLVETPMVSGRQYLLKSHLATALCTPGKLKHRIDITTFEQVAAQELGLNDIGDCDLFLDRSIAFSPYETSRESGSFILIDRLTHNTVAAGFIHSALRSPIPDSPFPPLVDRNRRAAIKNQKPVVLWFTGLSGAGKSTIANLVEQKLNVMEKHSMLLDGDYIRHTINRDLDFTDSGRAENIRRIVEIAKLMTDAGLITLVSFISPFRAERDMARQRIGSEQFLEIHVDVPLAVAEARDVKGLYKKAREFALENFTGISSPYEIPEHPDLQIKTEVISVEDAVKQIMALLHRKGFVRSSLE